MVAHHAWTMTKDYKQCFLLLNITMKKLFQEFSNINFNFNRLNLSTCKRARVCSVWICSFVFRYTLKSDKSVLCTNRVTLLENVYWCFLNIYRTSELSFWNCYRKVRTNKIFVYLLLIRDYNSLHCFRFIIFLLS